MAWVAFLSPSMVAGCGGLVESEAPPSGQADAGAADRIDADTLDDLGTERAAPHDAITDEDTVDTPEAANPDSDGATVCAPPLADCNGLPADGCEANLETNVVHCGFCGHACGVPNATATCTNGKCTVSCALGFGDCNGNPDDGCEADQATDAQNCGSCGKVCAAPNATPKCSNATCGFACKAGFKDCNTLPGDGCEVNGTSDSKNCGSCGHDCLGGACASAACQPVGIATNQNNPYGLALDGTHVYWTNMSGNMVLKAPKTVGSSSVLASTSANPLGVAVDDAAVYWVQSSGSLWSVSKNGGVKTVLVSGIAFPGSVATDDGYIFWNDNYPNAIARLAKGGGSPMVICNAADRPYAIALDGESVYAAVYGGVAKDGYILAAGKNGGPCQKLAANQDHPTSVVADATHVYWANSIPGGPTAHIMRLTKPSGNPQLVAQIPVGLVQLATDSPWLYASNAGGTLARVSKGTGTASTLASTGPGVFGAIAVDDASVYWATYTAIMKVAK